MSLTSRCGVCLVDHDLVKCDRCRVVQYCSREHQAADSERHRPSCTDVRERREKFEIEDKWLNEFPDMFMPYANPLSYAAGKYWNIVGTRNYMVARYDMVQALFKVNTLEAVTDAHDHLMDMLHLARGDNMCLREIIPFLMLRLNMDQKCYDFVKWWTVITSTDDDYYDLGDTSTPFLTIDNANALEPMDWLPGESPSLFHALALILLKIKLIQDLQTLRNAAVLGKKHPQEVVDRIKLFVPLSPIISGLPKIALLTNEQLSQITKRLQRQVEQLYTVVQISNRHLWPALVSSYVQDPDQKLLERPAYYEKGSRKQKDIILTFSYSAWRETPGALDLINRRLKTGKWVAGPDDRRHE